MTERIRWEDDGLSGNYVGHVGTAAEPAFKLYSLGGADPGWLLSVRLCSAGKFFRSDDPDKLKAEAEQWLERFVSSLGAVFPVDIRNHDLHVPLIDEEPATPETPSKTAGTETGQ